MTHGKLLLFALGLAALTGCSTGPVDATYLHEIAPFEDYKVAWTGCLRDQQTGQLQNPNCQLSDPVILRLDARVREAESQLPVNNVRVWFNSGFNKIYLLPQEVLEAIEVPVTSGWDGVLDRGEVWAEFSGTFEGDYRPTYHETWTDARGMATVWLWIEEMPTTPDGAAIEASVVVSIASESAVVELQAGG